MGRGKQNVRIHHISINISPFRSAEKILSIWHSYSSQGSERGSRSGYVFGAFFFADLDFLRPDFFSVLLFFFFSALPARFSAPSLRCPRLPATSVGATSPPGRQLLTMTPAPIHKRAAAATAASPLLSFDVSGCFIPRSYWRACARSRQE